MCIQISRGGCCDLVVAPDELRFRHVLGRWCLAMSHAMSDAFVEVLFNNQQSLVAHCLTGQAFTAQDNISVEDMRMYMCTLYPFSSTPLHSYTHIPFYHCTLEP